MVLYERFNTGDDNVVHMFGNNWIGQSFTVGNTGTNENFELTYVKLLIYKALTPGTFNVYLRAVDAAHLPTGGNLSSGTINGDTLTTNTAGEWKQINMSAYECQASTEYAIVCETPDGTGTGDDVNWRCDASSPGYTGGRGSYSSNDGVTWNDYSAIDCLFEVYGPADVAFNATTLTLSTTEETPAYIIQVSKNNLALTITLETPTIINTTIIPFYYSNPGTLGSAVLSSTYPVTDGLISGTTTQVGHKETLEYEPQSIPNANKEISEAQIKEHLEPEINLISSWGGI